VTVGVERTFGEADDVQVSTTLVCIQCTLNVGYLRTYTEVSICLLFSLPSPTLLPQVLSDVVPEIDPPLPPFTDLLFFGTRGPAVSTFQIRKNTETVAMKFTEEATSIVTIPVQYHPETITNQLTITYVQALAMSFAFLHPLYSLVQLGGQLVIAPCVTTQFFPLCSVWLQITAGFSGVLVAKTTDGGSTQFMLSRCRLMVGTSSFDSLTSQAPVWYVISLWFILFTVPITVNLLACGVVLPPLNACMYMYLSTFPPSSLAPVVWRYQ